ncbi:hypothetical protein WG915_01590 [Corynebacterium sp. H128]|uniref:hypothetical protein n=1 Tax=Corynebacterium sp. H128 TaxID=3133427 RepID=UPI0030A110A0
MASVAASFLIFTGTAVAQPDSEVEETNKWYAEVLADESVADGVDTDSAVSLEQAQVEAQATEVSEDLTMSALGLVGDNEVQSISDGEMQALAVRNCQTFLPLNHQVCGAILAKYLSMGGPTSWLLWPTSGELGNPDGVGARSQFHNGLIYWHPNHGAWSVQPLMMEIWGRTGYERGVLGYPVTDSFAGVDRVGQKQLFAGGGAYWKLGRGAAVYGKINEKYVSMGAENSWLGYPVAEEVGLPDGVGRMSRFEHGWIYWHPQHGAHPVGMDMFGQWEAQGYERGAWGYPTSDPVMDADGAYEYQQFQGGQKIGLTPPLWIIAQYTNRNVISETVARSREYSKMANLSVRAAINESAKEVIGQDAQTQIQGIASRNGGIRSEVIDPNWIQPHGVVKEAVIVSENQHRKGDVYYNWAGEHSENRMVQTDPSGVHVNYGHVGMFTDSTHIVEAVGVGSVTTKFAKDNTPYRFKVRRFHTGTSIGDLHIESATAYAEKAAARQAPYDLNPVFNKLPGADESLNCSELVWRAYRSLGGWVDLDSDGGPGVWPRDVRNSDHLVEYK